MGRLLGMVVAGLAFAAQARQVQGMEVPDQIEVAQKQLKLTGVAVQKKLVFDIYAVALWLEEPTKDPQVAAGSEQVKRLQLKLLRSASREQVADGLRGGFQKGNSDINAVVDRMEKLLSAIPDMSSGESITITYVPGEGTTLQSARGTRLTLPGSDFGEAMFNVWLGSDPGTERIKQELLIGGT